MMVSFGWYICAITKLFFQGALPPEPPPRTFLEKDSWNSKNLKTLDVWGKLLEELLAVRFPPHPLQELYTNF
jgi:hypothetical protein